MIHLLFAFLLFNYCCYQIAWNGSHVNSCSFVQLFTRSFSSFARNIKGKVSLPLCYERKQSHTDNKYQVNYPKQVTFFLLSDILNFLDLWNFCWEDPLVKCYVFLENNEQKNERPKHHRNSNYFIYFSILFQFHLMLTNFSSLNLSFPLQRIGNFMLAECCRSKFCRILADYKWIWRETLVKI